MTIFKPTMARAERLQIDLDRLRLELAAKDKLIAELRQPQPRGHCEICGGMLFVDHGHSCPRDHANAKIVELECDLTAARLLVESLQQEVKDADESVEALEAKAKALAPHGTCGCSYDQPGALCMHHSPMLAAAREEIERLSALNKRSICVYCGEAQSLDDPTQLRDVMTTHIVQCDRHPMNRVVGLMTGIEVLVERTMSCPHCFDLGSALAKQVEALNSDRLRKQGEG